MRNVETRKYFCHGQWTPDQSQAQHFPDSGKVIETCLQYHLRDVELVLQLSPEAVGLYDTHVRLFDYTPATSLVESLYIEGRGLRTPLRAGRSLD